jgi:hypothetical protein
MNIVHAQAALATKFIMALSAFIRLLSVFQRFTARITP